MDTATKRLYKQTFSLRFVDLQTGWICGDNGLIIKTTNSGINWISQISGTNNWLRSIYFINSQIGWCSGNSGTILKTTNGGLNWISQISTTGSSLFSIFFTDVQNGWAVGTVPGPYSYAPILKTTNGGTDWTLQFQSQGNLNTIYFINSLTGWALGCDIFKTTNGGDNWRTQANPTNECFYSVYFLNSETGWAVGYRGAIINTTNGGGITFILKTYENFPLKYFLYQNYPNPFNPITRIKFEIPGAVKRKTLDVRLIVFDILGKEIQTLVNEQLQPGTYEVTFDGSNLPSGVYFYKLTAGNYIETKKMLMIK